MTYELNNTDDVIDVRDMIARVEELEDERDSDADAAEFDNTPEGAELIALLAVLADLQGMGGDEQWRGDWYPITLIRDTYFKDYAQELAEETGAIPDNATWPCTCIDWDQAARELQYDYSGVEIDGITYWTR